MEIWKPWKESEPLSEISRTRVVGTQRWSDRSAGFENSRELAFSNRHDERRIITLHTKYRVARLPLNANAIILPGVFVLQFNLRRPGNTFLLIAPADLSTPWTRARAVLKLTINGLTSANDTKVGSVCAPISAMGITLCLRQQNASLILARLGVSAEERGGSVLRRPPLSSGFFQWYTTYPCNAKKTTVASILWIRRPLYGKRCHRRLNRTHGEISSRGSKRPNERFISVSSRLSARWLVNFGRRIYRISMKRDPSRAGILCKLDDLRASSGSTKWKRERLPFEGLVALHTGSTDACLCWCTIRIEFHWDNWQFSTPNIRRKRR